MSTIYGIDLGTYTTLVSGLDPQGIPRVLQNDVGESSIRSALYHDGNQWLIGTQAVHLGVVDPARLVVDAKRAMGEDRVLFTAPDGTEYRAPDCAQLILAHMAEIVERATGEPLSQAAISVPANFTDAQKEATKMAAEAAGIAVDLLTPEPTAAVFGHGANKRGDGLVLIVDLGGGTFDVSLAEVSGNTVQILTTSGVPKLGGADFNERLCGIVLERFEQEHKFPVTREAHPVVWQELHQRVEQAKLTLSAREEAQVIINCDGSVLATTITRQEFNAATSGLVSQLLDCTEQTLTEAEVKAEALREIIPTGGGSLMPCVLEGIEQRLGRRPTSHAEPNFAVVKGCVIMGRMDREKQGFRVSVGPRTLPPLDYRVRDVTAHAIGVSVVTDNGELVNSVILAKGMPIPSDRTERYRLADAGQTGVLIRFLQGIDGAPESECQILGTIEMDDLTPVFGRPHVLDVRLRLDKNGMLTGEAYDPISDKHAELVLEYKEKQEAA